MRKRAYILIGLGLGVISGLAAISAHACTVFHFIYASYGGQSELSVAPANAACVGGLKALANSFCNDVNNADLTDLSYALKRMRIDSIQFSMVSPVGRGGASLRPSIDGSKLIYPVDSSSCVKDTVPQITAFLSRQNPARAMIDIPEVGLPGSASAGELLPI